MKTRNVTLPDGRVVEAVPMNVTDKEVVAKYGGEYFRQGEQTSRQNLRQTVARLAKSNQNRVYTEVPHPLNTDYWVDYALDAVTGGNRIETAKKSAEAYQTAYNQLQYNRAKAQEQESIAAAAEARRSGLGAEVLHKAKLAGQAGLRGAAMAFDLKALPDMLYSLTTGLQVPNMQRDNLTTTGQVPTTHLGRYMRSGIEGLSAGVTGASGVIGAGRQVAKAVTPTWAARQAARSNVPTIRASQAVREGSIMRRSAAGGLAGGLGSEAGADLTRSPDAPEGTNAGRLLGGLLGGAAGAAVGRLGHLSTTRTDAAQYAVKGLLPEELQAAQAGQQLAASQGVNTTLNQHLRRSSNLDKLVEINANRPVGEKTQEVLRHQPEQIKALAQQQVDALPGQATTDTTALGTRLTTAAGQRIDQAEGNAKLAWRIGYGRQMQAAQDDANRALADASTRARAQQGVANQAQVRLQTAQQRREQAELLKQQEAAASLEARQRQYDLTSAIRNQSIGMGRKPPQVLDNPKPVPELRPPEPATLELEAEAIAQTRAARAQQQAQQALANEKGARKAVRTAGQLTRDEVDEIAKYLRNAARENPNMQEGSWAEGLANSLYKPDGSPITSPQQLSNILKRGVVTSPEQRMGESTVNKASEAIFGGIRGKALDMLRERSEAIARADEAFKAVKTQEVNPLREGVVGRLAGTGKGWENPGVNADFLIGELDKGLLAGQTRSPFTTLRQEFSKLPLDQRVQAYGALQDAAKTWIATKVDRAMKASSNRTDSDIATALTREFGVPGDNHSAILGTKRVLEDWAVMQGLPPKEFSKGFLNALRTFAAAANRPSTVSGGTRGDVRKVMRLPVVDSVGRVNVIQPLRQLFIGANNRYEADAFRFIDDVLTDPNGLDMLLKMAKEPTVNRTTAQLLSSWMATSGQGSRAEVNTTESPE